MQNQIQFEVQNHEQRSLDEVENSLSVLEAKHRKHIFDFWNSIDSEAPNLDVSKTKLHRDLSFAKLISNPGYRRSDAYPEFESPSEDVILNVVNSIKSDEISHGITRDEPKVHCILTTENGFTVVHKIEFEDLYGRSAEYIDSETDDVFWEFDVTEFTMKNNSSFITPHIFLVGTVDEEGDNWEPGTSLNFDHVVNYASLIADFRHAKGLLKDECGQSFPYCNYGLMSYFQSGYELEIDEERRLISALIESGRQAESEKSMLKSALFETHSEIRSVTEEIQNLSRKLDLLKSKAREDRLVALEDFFQIKRGDRIYQPSTQTQATLSSKDGYFIFLREDVSAEHRNSVFSDESVLSSLRRGEWEKMDSRNQSFERNR